MNSPTLIVTGASGFLGSHIMQQRPPGDCLGVYHRNRPQNDGRDYLPCDLSEPEKFLKILHEIRPAALIHAAAKINVDWCEKNPESTWTVNAELPVILAKACADLGCKFVFISSDMVFDGKKGEYVETDAANPISHYGRSKAAAEEGVLRIDPQAIVARVALIYGLPVSEGRGTSFLTWVLQRLAAGQPVPLFYDQYRTPVEVTELAVTLQKLAHSSFSGVIHIAGSEKNDRYTFGKYVCQCTGYDEALLQKVSYRAGLAGVPRPRDLSMRTDMLQKVIGGSLSDCATALQQILPKK